MLKPLMTQEIKPLIISPATNSIHLSKTVNVRNAGTVAHKLGHAVDFMVGTNSTPLSYSGNLTSIIDKYYATNKNNLLKGVINYLENINNKVSKLLTKSVDNGIINNNLIRLKRVELLIYLGCSLN